MSVFCRTCLHVSLPSKCFHRLAVFVQPSQKQRPKLFKERDRYGRSKKSNTLLTRKPVLANCNSSNYCFCFNGSSMLKFVPLSVHDRNNFHQYNQCRTVCLINRNHFESTDQPITSLLRFVNTYLSKRLNIWPSWN